MSEKIVIFNWINWQEKLLVDRTKFYSERRTTFNDHYIYVIDLFLITSNWKIILQKRGRHKKNAPWQLHTSAWWHVNDNENPEFTLIHESIEELWVPCTIVPSDQDFQAAINKLKNYTNKIAIVKHYKDYYRTLTQYTDPAWRSIDAKDRVFLCFWIYDWPVQSLDNSSDWFELFELDTLKTELTKNPLSFTTILHNFIDEMWDEIWNFITNYCN